MMDRIAESDDVMVGEGAICVNGQAEAWNFRSALEELAQASRAGYHSGVAAGRRLAMKEKNSAWQAGFLGGFLAGGVVIGLAWAIVEALR